MLMIAQVQSYDKKLISSKDDKEPLSKAMRGNASALAVYQLECDPSTTPGAAVVVVMFMKQASSRFTMLNLNRPQTERVGLPFVMAVTPATTNRQVISTVPHPCLLA